MVLGHKRASRDLAGTHLGRSKPIPRSARITVRLVIYIVTAKFHCPLHFGNDSIILEILWFYWEPRVHRRGEVT